MDSIDHSIVLQGGLTFITAMSFMEFSREFTNKMEKYGYSSLYVRLIIMIIIIIFIIYLSYKHTLENENENENKNKNKNENKNENKKLTLKQK